MQIITNNVPRDVIYGWELTPREREEFDYIDWEAEERGDTTTAFFRYKGQLYDLGEFESTSPYTDGRYEWLKGWHGYQSDSFFSGIVIRYSDDWEWVVVGRYST